MLKCSVRLIKDKEFKHREKAEKTQQEKRPVDDEYELLKYSLLPRSDCPLIDVVGKDTFDNLICIWFADVHTSTPDQKKLNEEMLMILKDLPYFSDSSHPIVDGYITRLKGLFQKNHGNDYLKTVLNLERGESRLTALHLVSSINDPAVEKLMDLLSEAGAEINKKDNREKTPLHYAAYSGCGKSVDLLLEKGALNTPDEQEEIPLEVAIGNHNYNVKRLLLIDKQKSLEEKLYRALNKR
ncbi:ankyrin repeat domain-containing protein [Wolbachia pipientis]|uniref:ankyrin repeat domain-containing protein n=1 Tax=Wolbachia pipientis TaxID=955 RepID=UPI0025A46277|nr:ankyrin repeat domain-containing protein [Wolbachia pipientis]MDM8335081.1 ankyrin repeat domain-containing protein [Wolbachia pipientis]